MPKVFKKSESVKFETALGTIKTGRVIARLESGEYEVLAEDGQRFKCDPILMYHRQHKQQP